MEVDIREERVVILAEFRAVAFGAGVLATQAGYYAPTVESGPHDAVEGNNLFVVVDVETLPLVDEPLCAFFVFVEGLRLHPIVGVLGSCLHDDALVEVLLPCEAGGRHAVGGCGEVAVERIKPIYTTLIVMAVVVFAYLIVGQKFKGRTEGIDFPDIIKGTSHIPLVVMPQKSGVGLLVECLASQ